MSPTLSHRTLETAHTICTWMWLYYLTVTNFGNLAAMDELPMMFNLTTPLSTVASALVQARCSFCCLTVVSCMFIRPSFRTVFTS
jgi:hypothetical protein